MTTMMRINCTCSVCGASNEFRVLGSSNTFGSPDLDLRPAQMLRGTMHLWAQECENCGYVSEDISEPATVTRDWLGSQGYRTCDGIPFSSDLARRFYREYLIRTEEKRPAEAFLALLHAAWDCDDEEDLENARHCRVLALSQLKKLEEKDTLDDNLIVRKADIMRRAGLFNELVNEYSSLHFGNDLLDRIVRFQIERAKEKDTACYRVEDVTGK